MDGNCVNVDLWIDTHGAKEGASNPSIALLTQSLQVLSAHTDNFSSITSQMSRENGQLHGGHSQPGPLL